jgi:hypothetical protein
MLVYSIEDLSGCLKWNRDSKPYFLLKLHGTKLDIQPLQYAIYVENELLGVIFPQKNGCFSCLSDLKINCDKPDTIVSFISGRETNLLNYVKLKLWNADKKLNVFNSDGTYLKKRAAKINNHDMYYLLAKDELDICRYRRININKEWVLYQIDGYQLLGLEDIFSDEEIWGETQSKINFQLNNNTYLPWVNRITLKPVLTHKFPRLGDYITFAISLPNKKFKLMKLVYKNKKIGFSKDGPRYITKPILVDDIHPNFKLEVANAYTEGTIWIDKKPRIVWQGASLLKDNKLKVIIRNSIIKREDLELYPLQVHLPREWKQPENRQKLRLLEGYQILSEVKASPIALRRVGGFGAPLVLREPYNSEYHESIFLCKEVVDNGLIERIETDSVNQVTSIVFTQIYHKSKDHLILIWTPTGNVEIIRFENDIQHIVKDNVSIWTISTNINNEFAIMVAYRGYWVGTWYSDNFFEYLQENVRNVNSHEFVAAMLRWSKSPLLSNKLRPIVQIMLTLNQDQVVFAWLFNKGLPAPLVFSPMNEEEKAALRYYLLDLRLNNGSFKRLTDMYLDNYLQLNVLQLSLFLKNIKEKVSDITPLLYVSIVKHFVYKVKKEVGIIEAEKLVNLIKADVLGLEKYTYKDFQRCLEILSNYAANESGVDITFIEVGLVNRSLDWLHGISLGKWGRPNILSACSFPYLRNYLCANILVDVLD